MVDFSVVVPRSPNSANGCDDCGTVVSTKFNTVDTFDDLIVCKEELLVELFSAVTTISILGVWVSSVVGVVVGSITSFVALVSW